MQKKQLKNLRGNIDEIQKMLKDKKEKKKHLTKENYQEDLQQENCLDNQIYHKRLFTDCNWYFDTLKSSKM